MAAKLARLGEGAIHATPPRHDPMGECCGVVTRLSDQSSASWWIDAPRPVAVMHVSDSPRSTHWRVDASVLALFVCAAVASYCLDCHEAKVDGSAGAGLCCRLSPPSRPQVNSVGFSSDDSRVVCGDNAKKVTVLDAASGKVAWEQELGGGVRASLTRVCLAQPVSALAGLPCAPYVRREGAGVSGRCEGAWHVALTHRICAQGVGHRAAACSCVQLSGGAVCAWLCMGSWVERCFALPCMAARGVVYAMRREHE